jgi:hypothetical protein
MDFVGMCSISMDPTTLLTIWHRNQSGRDAREDGRGCTLVPHLATDFSTNQRSLQEINSQKSDGENSMHEWNQHNERTMDKSSFTNQSYPGLMGRLFSCS